MIMKHFTSETAVSLDRVSYQYRNNKALDNITAEIPGGVITGVIGPDGVGKSTLLTLIAGVREAQKGDISVLNGDIKDEKFRRAVCSKIAYMPQGHGSNLYQSLSVYENIDFFGRLFGVSSAERKERINNLLISTGLYNFSDRYVHKLSGGMKQKLGLCCSLIHQPELLMLDEPTTGIDPLSRRQFWELISEIRLQTSNISIIVATAYMEEAEEFEWLIAMDQGSILATGTPSAIKEKSNSASLEEAFINLMPENKRAKHRKLVIPDKIRDEGKVAIEAKGLSKKFGNFTAVDKVNFKIEKGEIYGFLGSNGCGKTTTMKMLTGLLPATGGEIVLFGHIPDSTDMEIRRKVGYMSQFFSLYSELTVIQNLELHARLFHLPQRERPDRIRELVKRMELEGVLEETAGKLPLGVKQRLSLAVAIIHYPELLILDEPTSGVDPVARDRFWELLITISREKGVTIFISTHFMNEAERCDRISLMHSGKVLATGPPSELVKLKNADNLEDAFISFIEEVEGTESRDLKQIYQTEQATDNNFPVYLQQGLFNLSVFNRLGAFVAREALEIIRDPVRITFALIGPLLLLIVFGYGISFDVENIKYAAYDRDKSPASRNYLENFSGSAYFREKPPVSSYSDLETRLKSGKLVFAIEIPPGYGRDLKKGARPELGVWIEGGNPFRAELARNYISGIQQNYISDITTESQWQQMRIPPYNAVIRFRYNEDLKSVVAIIPGVIAMLLTIIPSILTAVGVVREKELGTITNLYTTPATRMEFLIGKQIPYIVLGFINLCCFLLITVLLFGVRIEGSAGALFLGAVLFITATTGFGLLVSAFTTTQIAALVGTFIISTVTSMTFSGFLQPVSSLTGMGTMLAATFPTRYFMDISKGTFAKALTLTDMTESYIYIMIFAITFLLLSTALLPRQHKQ